MKALFPAAIALASPLMMGGGTPFAQTARAQLDPPATGQLPAATAAPSPAPAAPATPAGANYDEARVPAYTLPDPLVLLNGKKVTDAKTWTRKRRPEILKLFETHVYGRAPVGRPKEMIWEVASADRDAMGGKAITKTVTLYFTGKKDGPPCTRMNLYMTLPKTGRPVPVFLIAGYGFFGRPPPFNAQVFDRGYGMVHCDILAVQKDQKDEAGGYATSIRKYYAPAIQQEPGEFDWGALGAWAWAMSRAMDYLQTDRDVDAKRVYLNGVSRYGKVVMWAGAQDLRFATTFSGESGCGGAVIVRRQYGETVRNITGFAPYWFNRKFREYGSDVNALPVDWHELVALYAPRPVYIATAEGDRWGDPRGSFLAAREAAPVYALFGKSGVGVDEMPPVSTPVGDTIGFHMRTGSHGQNDYDWEQYLSFVDKHFGAPKRPG